MVTNVLAVIIDNICDCWLQQGMYQDDHKSWGKGDPHMKSMEGRSHSGVNSRRGAVQNMNGRVTLGLTFRGLPPISGLELRTS